MVRSEFRSSVRAPIQNTNWGISTVSDYGFTPKVYAVNWRPVDEYHYITFYMQVKMRILVFMYFKYSDLV